MPRTLYPVRSYGVARAAGGTPNYLDFRATQSMHVCLNSGGKRYSDIADPKTLGEASMAWGIIGILGVIVLLLIKIYPQALKKNPDLANLTMLLALTGA